MANIDCYQYLLNFVQKPSNTTWKIYNKQKYGNSTVYHIILTLESFPYTNRHIWEHQIFIYVPDILERTLFFMRIGSGKLNEVHPINTTIIDMSCKLKTIMIEMYDVPNQPLRFDDTNNDNHFLCEDDLMAYSWKKFINSSNIPHIINFHMVKSIIQGMNCIDAFYTTHLNMSNCQPNYILVGASKRGSTIWLTSSVDTRVKAIIPIVYDTLNTSITIQNQKDKYGSFATKLFPYVQHGLFDMLDHKLFAIIDPLNYDKYINIPKFIINASNDNFFAPDSSNYYYDLIKGMKYLRYIPNANHYIEFNSLQKQIECIYDIILNKKKYEYSITNTNNVINILNINTTNKIINVNIWYSQNDIFDFGIHQFVPFHCINIDSCISNEIEINVNDTINKLFVTDVFF